MKNILNKNLYLKLYNKMLLIREVEEKIAEKYNENKMRCPTHLCIGQEAISSGVSSNLKKIDTVVSTHRSHGHYLGKGGNLQKMIAEIYGKSDGCSKGYGGSMHLIDLNVNFMGSTAIVGNSMPVGVGLAMSSKLENYKSISCIYFGEGCTEEGVFSESINFAVLKNLPALFICENNLYSVYSKLEVRQPADRKIYKMVRAMGIKTFYADGNKILDVYNVSNNAINYIKKNKKPVFIEFYTYRWREHCGPNYDNNIGYRNENEYLYWKNKDPIKTFKNYLLKNKIFTNNFLNKNDIKITNTVLDAFNFAEKSKFPSNKNKFKNIYA